MMLPHDIYEEQAQSANKRKRQQQARNNFVSERKHQALNSRSAAAAPSTPEVKQKVMSTAGSSKQQVITHQRRGYFYNPETGRLDRIIRRRKRKTSEQLRSLNKQFDSNPHWSKETL